MKTAIRLFARFFFSSGFLIVVLAALAIAYASNPAAAKYASVVMDARNGNILYSRNADQRLHPASLTKMMTVYVAIQAVENGEIDLDTFVRISNHAASEPSIKINLRAGSIVKLRYLIRAAAVRSANDAATAIAEAISGSERAFAERMNRTAAAMGMTRTRFHNAHGLTQSGHLSTARDMTILGRHIIYDYPEYYHLFSKRVADVGGTLVKHTNRRFLSSYSGADGIKTGYTSKAGFNLTASAARGNERIIVTVFGGRSVTTRDNHVAELMNKGFAIASPNDPARKLQRPSIPFGMVARVDTTVQAASPRLRRPESNHIMVASADAAQQSGAAISEGDADPQDALIQAANQTELELPEALELSRPLRRQTALANAEVNFSRINGIHLGQFHTAVAADRHMLRVQMIDFKSLGAAEKSIRLINNAYEAKLLRLSSDEARKACARLKARDIECNLISEA